MDRRASGGAGAGSDMEAFVAWLRRAAAVYHAPPPAPGDRMWTAVEAGWRAGGSVRDEPLAAAASRYHPPPETPREEMWTRVEAAWRLRRRQGGLAAGGGGAGEAAGERSLEAGPRGRRRWAPWAWAGGIAAALVLGVLVGRGSVGVPGASTRVAEVPASDAGTRSASHDRGAAGDEAPGPEAEEASGRQTAPGRGTVAAVTEAPEPGAETGEPGAEVGAAGTDAGAPVTEAGARRAEAGGPATEPREPAADPVGRAAAVDHLARVETFLTAFRAGEAMAERPLATRWARDLLLETRFLMDWSADRDPRLSVMLEQLELVLAEIVRLEAGDGERRWILEGMERNDVLPRLRSAMPAGPVALHAEGD